MKKFIQILSATVVSFGMMAGVAGATASNCPDSTIENTGQGSTNTITCETTQSTHVTCINDVYVVGINGQQASSGNGSSNSNTTGGVVVTGNATNDNSQTVQVGASCGAAATVATVNTPATPAAGKGAAASTPAAPAPASANVASLPHTGSNSVLDATVAGVAVVGGAMAVSQLGVSAYRRFALK